MEGVLLGGRAVSNQPKVRAYRSSSLPAWRKGSWVWKGGPRPAEVPGPQSSLLDWAEQSSMTGILIRSKQKSWSITKNVVILYIYVYMYNYIYIHMFYPCYHVYLQYHQMYCWWSWTLSGQCSQWILTVTKEEDRKILAHKEDGHIIEETDINDAISSLCMLRSVRKH